MVLPSNKSEFEKINRIYSKGVLKYILCIIIQTKEQMFDKCIVTCYNGGE